MRERREGKWRGAEHESRLRPTAPYKMWTLADVVIRL